MKVRFLSSVPCALTVGGKYYGVTDGFERFAEITLKDNLFACFSPQNALPLGVFLNENLFFAPPEGVYVCLLRDGAAVYARSFPPRLSETRIVAQERFVADLITVFFQGSLFISLKRPPDFTYRRCRSVTKTQPYRNTANCISSREKTRFVFSTRAEKNCSTKKCFPTPRTKPR